ncbi:MAG TPA: hypothetical protein HA306_11210 [Methanosarcina sp.]|nr:hypothetical protein [Methanosarcina sp.]
MRIQLNLHITIFTGNSYPPGSAPIFRRKTDAKSGVHYTADLTDMKQNIMRQGGDTA